MTEQVAPSAKELPPLHPSWLVAIPIFLFACVLGFNIVAGMWTQIGVFQSHQVLGVTPTIIGILAIMRFHPGPLLTLGIFGGCLLTLMTSDSWVPSLVQQSGMALSGLFLPIVTLALVIIGWKMVGLYGKVLGAGFFLGSLAAGIFIWLVLGFGGH
jgi:hypothetical protein